MTFAKMHLGFAQAVERLTRKIGKLVHQPIARIMDSF